MASGATSSDKMQMAACKSERAAEGVKLPPVWPRREMRANRQNQAQAFDRDTSEHKTCLRSKRSQQDQCRENQHPAR